MELILQGLNGLGKINTIEVYDVSGRTVYKQHFGRVLSDKRIHILTNGVYVVRLNTEAGLIAKKFFI